MVEKSGVDREGVVASQPARLASWYYRTGSQPPSEFLELSLKEGSL